MTHKPPRLRRLLQRVLPPTPPLDIQRFRTESVTLDGLGDLSALRPVDDAYLSSDPNAPALVLVPGLGMDAIGFLRQLPLGSVADLHMIQTNTYPCCGEAGLGHFARCVEAYITSRGLDKRPGGVVLGGCSMGGAVSLATAIRARVELRGLVLLGTFGNSRHLPLWQRVGQPLSWVIPPWMLRRAAHVAMTRTQLFGKLPIQELGWMLSYRKDWTCGYYGRATGALTRMNQIEGAKKLKVRTLVVHGTDDKVLPYAAGVELAESIPGAKLVTIQDSGHAFFFTDHEPVNAAVAEFISDLCPPKD